METSHLPGYFKDGQDRQCVGKRFYQPWVLAAYCILANLPFAILLYGLNIYHRGSLWIGKIILIASALGVIGICITSAIGTLNGHGIPMFLFNLFMGIGLMKAEESNYKKALSNGALPAKW